MSDTLLALNRAVIAGPTDRTVRLVFADALDETGAPADAARAEFIRAQITLESDPTPGPGREALATRCDALFAEHWLDWWRPVAAEAGLPAPHVPTRRTRGRRGRRGERPAGWPYTQARETTIDLPDYGMAIRFAGGFPEEVRLTRFAALADGPELVHRWGDALPLVRLVLSAVHPMDWGRVNGSHLARLADLTLDAPPAEVVPLIVSSPHLTAVTRLTVRPIGANEGLARALVGSPAWAGLRSLRVTGALPPDAVAALARACTLGELEELELCLGNPADALGVRFGELLRALFGGSAGGVAQPLLGGVFEAITGGIVSPSWPGFGPALEVLAAAPWARRLRRLRVTSAAAGRAGLSDGQGGPGEPIPDGAVHALVGALDPDKLEGLVLPAAAVGPAARVAVAERLGGRVAFR